MTPRMFCQCLIWEFFRHILLGETYSWAETYHFELIYLQSHVIVHTHRVLSLYVEGGISSVQCNISLSGACDIIVVVAVDVYYCNGNLKLTP